MIGVIRYGYWFPNRVRNFGELDGVSVKWCADKREDREEAGGVFSGKFLATRAGLRDR